MPRFAGVLLGFNLWSSQKGRQQAERCAEGQPKSWHRPVSGDVNQVRADGGREASEDGCSQTVGKRKTRGPHTNRHDLGQENNHRAVVAPIEE